MTLIRVRVRASPPPPLAVTRWAASAGTDADYVHCLDIQDDDELVNPAWSPSSFQSHIDPGRASNDVGGLCCFHDRMPRSLGGRAILLASGPLLPGLHRPGLQIGSTNHSLAREFSFCCIGRKGKIARRNRGSYVRSAPPSVRRPRRNSAEPAWCARSLRAVVPSIGTNRLVQKISRFLCRTKDRRGRWRMHTRRRAYGIIRQDNFTRPSRGNLATQDAGNEDDVEGVENQVVRTAWWNGICGLAVQPAAATLITFTGASGTGDNAVSASAAFTTSAGSISVTLTNDASRRG